MKHDPFRNLFRAIYFVAWMAYRHKEDDVDRLAQLSESRRGRIELLTVAVICPIAGFLAAFNAQTTRALDVMVATSP